MGLVAQALDEVERRTRSPAGRPGRRGPGRNSSSRSLASPASGRSWRPSSSRTSLAALTWPRPPSTMTRSGIAQRRSSSFPSSPALTRPEPAAEHLLVAGEVVRSLDRPDPEPAVLAGARLAVLEHDHAADRFAALEVADVVALDAQRRPGRARAHPPAARARRGSCPGRPASGPARARGTRRRCAAASSRADRFSPRCGHADVDRPAAPLGEERLEVRGVGHRRRDVDLARDRRRPRVVLLEEAAPGPRRRSPRGRHRAGRRRARPSCRRGSRRAGPPPGCPARASPTRSSSVCANAAIFWLSIVRSIARILSRRTAARS